MENYKVRYKNSKFSNEKIILERGETEVSGSSFKNCKLMLKGNAYTVGKIIKFFTGKSPLKVLDMEEPLFEKVGRPMQKSTNRNLQEISAADEKRG